MSTSAMQKKAKVIRANLENGFNVARDNAIEYEERTAAFVKKNPMISLLAAIGAGFVVGQLLRRRGRNAVED